ncbi:D-alanine/D-alanine ligase [Xylanimonas cellulosilytica DSM 15894]|uniref:D-alanine--D-alanine ligase n=1 Tax=Xylanimonas cellulosilytica (strain DSM 15894 / JCM 12276 / CECT 5975 / KCTC 9989 / LMG 20990 / NBRC 107835 / XIL07) TaxID=446471 RepID=D1BRV4_XYLCX|nr:D-alanine--D-alanine ligase [Xylanimonas cellulosilytica]ACZ32370.1 D-alanine/D-alanine ligase [Xylanimonas cellulosilytica DSM 15894]
MTQSPTAIAGSSSQRDIVAPGLGAARAADHPVDGSALRVVVLAGGLSHERDVSLRSGRRVAEALRSVGVDVAVHDVDAQLLRYLDEHRPDVVWPLLHGAGGEDGSLRDVLELAGVPYVGTGPRASRLAWDKPIAKERLQTAGLATPEWLTLPQELFRDLGAQGVLSIVAERFGLPVVVKPTRGGSALGVTRVTSKDGLARAMVDCFAYGDSALIERAVDGVEIAVSVIDGMDGPVALPAVEIIVDGPYDFDARYNPGRVEYFAPARLSPDQAAHVAGVAVAAHQALDLRHLSRTDLILQTDGTAQVLEVNVAPGMTETSLLPQAAVAAGHDLGTLYRQVVEHAALRTAP